MSHAELILIAHEYRLPSAALEKISALILREIAASMGPLREALARVPDDHSAGDLKNTLANVMEMSLQTFDATLGGVSPSSTLPAHDTPERLKSIFIDMDGATFDGSMVSLHAEDETHASQRIDEGDRAPAIVFGGGSRYEDLGVLGVGGMGEVRRVRERDLNRTLAMKIIKPDVLAMPSSLSRFIEEAQVSAQLQHPSIIPTHELGRMPDGRYYFTMQEIRGRELSGAISAVHAASQDGGWGHDAEGWSLRQLVSALHQACQAVGYAHARGVVHRDLKPSNIMVGRDGEVFVVDWGIAKIKGREGLSEDAEWIETDRSRDDSLSTQAGALTGTPAYMSPEQAEGDVESIGTYSDVYALGAILYKILTGRVPYTGPTVMRLLIAVLNGDLTPPSEIATNPLPDELEEICLRALSLDPRDRFVDARALAEALAGWLDGAKRRERALELVEASHRARRDGDEMLRRAEVLEAEGEVLLEDVPAWAPEQQKHAGWALEDEARALRQDARLRGLEATQALHASLAYVPDLPEAHQILAEHHLSLHRSAEGVRDQARASAEEVLVRAHAQALPKGAVRERLAAYLKGIGALTLVTEPIGAEAILYRVETRHRRLVPVLDRSLGCTPLLEVPLAMGSYLVELRLDGHIPVRYPVLIERAQHWDGVRPGATEPHPVVLPLEGSLGPDACYVPAGWFWAGGDPKAFGCWPRQRYWADAFVVHQYPITNRQYLAFLDALVAEGREDEALRHVPRERAGSSEEIGAMIYGRNAQGRFELRPDAEGDVWLDDEPVCMIDWHGARAYAAWRAQQTGQAWRLLTEQEWEKAARGVDGRFFPWGDVLDPSWCCMRDSHQGPPHPARTDSFPVDTSVFGVRGLAGNYRDWCHDVYRAEPPPPGVTLHPSSGSLANVPGELRTYRGGLWAVGPLYCRAATRYGNPPTFRGGSVSARIARSLISEP